jgi:hypothetical protein
VFNIFLYWLKKNNQGDTAKYEFKKNNQGAKGEDYLPYNDENDLDYLTCRALSKSFDRKYFEKLLVENGLDEYIDFDEFFST